MNATTTKTVLITGATGFIGKKWIEKLLHEGHSAIGISRRDLSHKDEPSLQWLSWDQLQNPEGPTLGLLKKVTDVVHLAGENISDGRWTEARKEILRESRIKPIIMLSETLSQFCPHVQTFISASGISYYGERGAELIDETQGPGNSFLSQLTVDWENALWSSKPVTSRKVALRIAPVLANESGILKKMLPIFKLGLGSPLGSGNQYMPWIHSFDLIEVLWFSLNNPLVQGPINAVGPLSVTNREFTQALAKAVHRWTFVPVPQFALKIGLGEMAELLLTGQNAVPKKLLDLGFKFKFKTLEAALSHLL